MSPKPQLKSLESMLLRRGQIAARAGLTHLTSTGAYLRDMYDALGYLRELSAKNYRDRYERGGIAASIIEAYPSATWADGAGIVETPDPNDETPFEADVNGLFSRLDVWSRLLRADILAGLGQYSVLLIGAKGDSKSPLPQMTSPDDVLYFTPVAEENAEIVSFVTSLTDARFGLPEMYSLTLGPTGSDITKQLVKKVHWSRIIHIAEGLLEDDIYGRPRLRPVWNYLDDLDKNVGGGSEAAWKRMDPGLQLDLDPEVELSSDEEEALNDEVDEYIHNYRRVMRTRGVSLNQLSSAVANFGGNVDTVLKLISATIGIPLRILTGSERGELASTQDRNNWNDRISVRRSRFAIHIITTLIDRLIEKGALTTPVSYELTWPDIDELDEKSKAEVLNKMANANSSQHASEGRVIVSADELRTTVLGLSAVGDALDKTVEGVDTEDADIDTVTDDPDGTSEPAVDPEADVKEKNRTSKDL